MSDKNFLHVYEGLCFEELKAGGNPSELANIQRRIAAELYVAEQSNLRYILNSLTFSVTIVAIRVLY